MKLSKREKILLIILGCLVFVFISWRVVLTPAITQYYAHKQAIANLNAQIGDLETMAGTQPALLSNLQKAKETMESETYFYRDLSSADVDRMLSSLASQNKMDATRIAIKQTEATEVTPFISAAPVMMDSLLRQRLLFDTDAQQRHASDTELLQQQSVQQKNTNTLTVPTYACEMDVSGTSDNLAALLAAINSTGHSMYLTKVTTPKPAYELGDKQNITDGTFTGTLFIQVYYLVN